MSIELPTILFVDEDFESCHTYIKAIQENGFAVTFSSNFEEARNFAMSHNFKLIISNVGLGELNGVDLCKFLKEKMPKKCPIILFDNKDGLDFLENGLNAGADDFFIKDGSPDIVIDCIKFWMESGFQNLPNLSRKKALEIAYLDMGDQPLKGSVELETDLLSTLAKQVSSEMIAQNPNFGITLVDRIYFLGRISFLVLGMCENLVSSIHFPKYLYKVVQQFDFPWIDDVDMLLNYFDSFSENPSFQEGANEDVFGKA